MWYNQIMAKKNPPLAIPYDDPDIDPEAYPSDDECIDVGADPDVIEQRDINWYFPTLSYAQNVFLREWLTNGHRTIDAYKAAYSTNAKDSVIRIQAYRVLNSPAIRAVITDLQRRAVARSAISLEHHLTELAVLRDQARAAGQYSAAIAAEIARGKVGGYYIERAIIKNTVPDANKGVGSRDEFLELAKQLIKAV